MPTNLDLYLQQAQITGDTAQDFQDRLPRNPTAVAPQITASTVTASELTVVGAADQVIPAPVSIQGGVRVISVQGPQGAQGYTGSRGAQGLQGPQGPQGINAEIVAGTVTEGAELAVNLVAESPTRSVLNLTLPTPSQAATVSSTAPLDPEPGRLWLNDQTGRLLAYVGGGWLSTGGPQGATGYVGSQGDVGYTGSQGLKGDPGDPGAAADVYDTATASTGFFSLPVGDDAARPLTPADGYTRINTVSDSLEVYYAGQWNVIKRLGFEVTSTTVTAYDYLGYRYFEFTELSTPLGFTVTGGDGEIEILAVGAGGGAGGSDGPSGSGGAGGAAVIATLTVSAGDYSVYVGGGGGGGASGVAGTGGGTAGVNGGGRGGNAGTGGSSGGGGGGGGWSGIFHNSSSTYLAVAGGGAGGGGANEGAANETTNYGGGNGSQRTDSVMTGGNGTDFSGDGGGWGGGGGGFAGGLGGTSMGGGSNHVAIAGSSNITITPGNDVSNSPTGGATPEFIFGNINSGNRTWGKGGNANSNAGNQGAVVIRVPI